MKLRCTENSIRLRLRKSDIEVLKTDKRVSEVIHFGLNTSFQFELCLADVPHPDALFEQGKIQVQLPKQKAEHWINSQEVGIEYTKILEEKNTLHLLIEKDFPCKDRTDEDKSDTFQELVPDQGDAC